MKTILITCFHPLISRNILASDTMKFLLESESVRVVITTPDWRASYLKKTFERDRVTVVGVPTKAPVRSLAGSFFKRLSRMLLSTNTTHLKAGAKLHLDHSVIWYFTLFLPLAWASRLSVVRSLVRWLDFQLTPGGYSDVFDTFKPDLLYSTDVQNEYDLLFMRSARSRGVRIVSQVRSWDNLTQWGMIRIIPDLLLVSSRFVTDEAARYHDIPKSSIVVVGYPHYDSYFRHETDSREEFFKREGLDPQKKLIVFAPIDDRRMRANELTRTWMKNDLDEYLLRALADVHENILVRFPPNTPVSIGNFTPPAHMHFDRPGVDLSSGDIIDRDVSPEDDRRLRNILRWADLLISGPSTMAIDAAIFDTPVILVNFVPTPRNFWHTIIEYGYNHIVNLVASGGVYVAKSREDLEGAIQRYLSDRALDQSDRKQLVREQCSITDAGSSRAVALILFQTLQYNFSSLRDKETLVRAIDHVAARTTELAKKIIGMSFPIRSLTVFSHEQAEYEVLTKILAELGSPYNENNGPRVKLYEPIIVGNNTITYLRIRKPDPERPEVGCNDFETDYEVFKGKYLAECPEHLRLIKRPTYEMIEFFDPTFDVLAYVVSQVETSHRNINKNHDVSKAGSMVEGLIRE